MDAIINPIVLDISHHNPVASFDAMRAFGIRGIIHKATQGIGFLDSAYAANRERATRAGMLWGAYHFADASDPDRQARFFLDVALPDDRMLLALDFEPNGNNTMTLAGARAFLRAVERLAGRKAVLYSGNLIKETLGDGEDGYLAAHRLWLAQYGPVPRAPRAWGSPWLWQFSGDGVNAHGIVVPGIGGAVDINSFAGSAGDLAAQWTNGAAVTPAPVAETAQKTLQRRLAARGFYRGAIDGIFGPLSVKAFQESVGFTGRNVDGIVGPMTRPLLEAALAKIAHQP